MEKNQNVAATAGNYLRAVYEHFAPYGIREGTAISPLNITEIYKKNYGDLKTSSDGDYYGADAPLAAVWKHRF